MAALVLKVKCKTGQHIVKDLKQSQTSDELKKVLSNLCSIPEKSLHVLHGFPPKPLIFSGVNDTLLQLGINTGDTLIVEEKPISDVDESNSVQNTSEAIKNTAPMEQNVSRGLLMRKVVPADNSCLFTSVGFVLSGKIDVGCESFMRQLIVEHVRADPETYSEAILGKVPEEYCQWILKSDSWGGAIELSILSKYYGMEIAVVDTLNAIINRFGEDQLYPHRVLLIFDGIHYDPIYMEIPETGVIQTIFPSDEDQILIDAEQLAQESKSSRQFTDVNKFNIRCMECKILLKGQAEAQAHAKSTKHFSFGEV